MKLLDIFQKLVCCACMRSQVNEENADVKESVSIHIKSSCCRHTKITNINITHDVDALVDVKEIIERLKNNALSMSRKNSGTL
jgi:hypothetical protein